MRRLEYDTRFFTTAALLGLFLLCQFLLRTSYWGGGLCTPKLVNPSDPIPADSYPLYTRTEFGFPLQFIAVTHDGCFSDRKTEIEWNVPLLLVDILIACVLGSLPYIIPQALKQLKQQRSRE